MTPTTTEHTPTTPARVLVIDDEAQIRRFLDISLRAQGYVVLQAADGRAGLETLATQGADLVILDIGLPDLDGHEVLAQLRQWSQVPVLMLSVRAAEGEKVAALDGGANDYVTKPFGTQELMARVRGLLRQHVVADASAPPLFDDGHLHIDLVRREVHLDGVPVVLTRKEFALLSLLVANAGRVVTQPQLLREVWGPTHTEDTHYLRVLVGKLRAKLGDSALAPKYLATEPGVGLRFLG
ncbi:response regulator [Pseudoxanthomonas winnipegensis]|jgi:two-component system KDP operon response regulator KdpE|uniref:Response regulator transcription factor n=1 Tax=Pseudoxanthomonas winnipegensis TaxID=2480810 RepID=A0A4Q8LBJ7_9GAMM|nr:response regulator transcription factor [Pseudoxanthomonas winnipegensis]PZP63600.1 MAG: DNA-binding response regulator [Pseudoxanthomonas spadix]TAA25754.1 response regulator transcription factor [Pseudoxanthomonas winnipegensis]